MNATESGESPRCHAFFTSLTRPLSWTGFFWATALPAAWLLFFLAPGPFLNWYFD